MAPFHAAAITPPMKAHDVDDEHAQYVQLLLHAERASKRRFEAASAAWQNARVANVPKDELDRLHARMKMATRDWMDKMHSYEALAAVSEGFPTSASAVEALTPSPIATRLAAPPIPVVPTVTPRTNVVNCQPIACVEWTSRKIGLPT